MPGINPAAGAALFGLLSAAFWGAGDFCGGLATRRASPNAVVFWSQASGAVLLFSLALLLRQSLPPLMAWGWGGLGGLAGAVGLNALYRALASGRMGVAAPLSAVLAAALPVVFNAVLAGLPGWVTLTGFALALVGVWLLASSEKLGTLQLRDLGLPLAAGLGFGLFFVFIARAGALTDGPSFWPLVAARAASLVLMGWLAARGRQPLRPPDSAWPLIGLSGVLDAAGNGFYAVAAQTGRLDVAAVLSSLYPASTVLLARAILKERFTRPQLAGIAAALAAIVLITL